MPNFLFVSAGAKAGLTTTTLGVVRAIEQSGFRPFFYKPIVQGRYENEDLDTASFFAKEVFKYTPPKPLSISEVEYFVSHNKDDEIVETIVGRLNSANQEDYDVTIIEGVVLDSESSFLSRQNLAIAQALHAKIVMVMAVDNLTAEQVADQLTLSLHEFSGCRIEVAGFILNRLPEGINKEQFIQTVIEKTRYEKGRLLCLGAIYNDEDKSARRMLDVARFLNAEVLTGHENLVTNRVKEYVVAGRSAPYMVDRFKAGALIISPGDREDIMMASALVTLSGIPLAGLVLTCDSRPSDNVLALVAPAIQNKVPVLITHHDTFHTAELVANQPLSIPFDDLPRIEGMINHVAESIKTDIFTADLNLSADLRLSPPAFRYRMMERSRAANKRIVLPEGAEPRTVQAAIICHEKGIARCVLLASKAEVNEVAKTNGLTLPKDLEVIDPASIRQHYIAPMVEMRKSRGLTEAQAEDQLGDNVVLGTMMLATGDVDGLVSGAVHTTANTIRPALQLIKTAPNASLVSSVFFMLMPEQVLVYGDCAVNPEPTAEQLADIAIQSADSAKLFGIEPCVAMISYSTGSSGAGADVEKVAKATELAKAKRPDLLIDGPLQYDAASVPSVGAQKAPNSLVAGKATVFVFPDLNTGNTTYKAVQRSANVVSVGPMLQGLNKPVNDLSRGALVDDIVYTIALTAIQALQTV